MLQESICVDELGVADSEPLNIRVEVNNSMAQQKQPKWIRYALGLRCHKVLI